MDIQNQVIIQHGIIHQMLIEHMVVLVYIMEILVLILVLVVVEVTGKTVLVVAHSLTQVVDREGVEIITQTADPVVTAEAVVAEVKHFSGDHGIISHHLGVQELVVEEVQLD